MPTARLSHIFVSIGGRGWNRTTNLSIKSRGVQVSRLLTFLSFVVCFVRLTECYLVSGVLLNLSTAVQGRHKSGHKCDSIFGTIMSELEKTGIYKGERLKGKRFVHDPSHRGWAIVLNTEQVQSNVYYFLDPPKGQPRTLPPNGSLTANQEEAVLEAMSKWDLEESERR